MSDPKDQVKAQMAAAVAATVASPDVKADLSAVPAIINALGPVVDAIMHSTNNEPWYQSRVFWGASLSAIAGILALFGIAFPSELQGQILAIIMAALPLGAAALTLYGRFRAKKPIGS